jgi:hypothetical protein
VLAGEGGGGGDEDGGCALEDNPRVRVLVTRERLVPTDDPA